MAVILRKRVVRHTQGTRAVRKSIGRIPVHDTADGNQVRSVAAGSEDRRLQFRMATSEAGDFLLRVCPAVVGEGDHTPICV